MQNPQIALRFYQKPVEDPEATARQGCPQFVMRDYVQKRVPGDATSLVDREVRKSDFEDASMPHFRQLYEHWKRGEEAPVSGLPIEQWPGCTAAQAMTLKAVNVRTVEELATVSDSNIMRLGMGFQTLRQKAQDYLAQAKDSSHLAKVRHEMDEMRSQLDAARRQLEEALTELRTLKAAPAQLPLDGKGKRA